MKIAVFMVGPGGLCLNIPRGAYAFLLGNRGPSGRKTQKRYY